MTSAILDMECIMSPDSNYLIKELSVIATDTWNTQHWIFKYNFTQTSNKNTRNVNKWLARNHHSMTPQYGDVEAEDISRILNSLTFTIIYVKGLQKKDILHQFIPHIQIINLEDIGCPRLSELTTEESYPSCLFHMNLNPKHCTFYKMFALRNWFVNIS